jgi:hypothetical protein
MRVLFLCPFELATLPVNLFAFCAPPEFFHRWVFVFELYFLSGLFCLNDDQFRTVAFDAPWQSGEQWKINFEEMGDFFKHFFAVSFFFDEVNGDFVVFALEELGVSGENDPALLLCNCTGQLVVSNCDVFSINAAISHDGWQFFEHVVNQKFWFLRGKNCLEFLVVHQAFRTVNVPNKIVNCHLTYDLKFRIILWWGFFRSLLLLIFFMLALDHFS